MQKKDYIPRLLCIEVCPPYWAGGCGIKRQLVGMILPTILTLVRLHLFRAFLGPMIAVRVLVGSQGWWQTRGCYAQLCSWCSAQAHSTLLRVALR